jgi:hypothetical protein
MEMSNEQSIKLRLKTAHVEIEYEGSEEFLRSDLLGLITEVAEIHKTHPPIETLAQQGSEQLGISSNGNSTVNLSLKSIAAKLNVKTGPDLALAACAFMALSENRDTFSRKDIIDSMRTAANFYKKSYNNNLSTYLDGLVKDGKILQQANDVYALHVQIRSEMESKLGN